MISGYVVAWAKDLVRCVSLYAIAKAADLATLDLRFPMPYLLS
jgi:hypothetical protein